MRVDAALHMLEDFVPGVHGLRGLTGLKSSSLPFPQLWKYCEKLAIRWRKLFSSRVRVWLWVWVRSVACGLDLAFFPCGSGRHFQKCNQLLLVSVRLAYCA